VTGDAAKRSEAWHRAPSGAVRRLGGFLRLLELDAAAAGGHPRRLRPDPLRRPAGRGPARSLPAGDPRCGGRAAGAPRPSVSADAVSPGFRSWFYGRNLNLSSPDLGRYFDEAALFDEQLAALLPPEHGFTTYLAGLLAALDHGRLFVARTPVRSPGQRYMFTTLRAHQEGGFIPPHFDNEQNFRPSYRHLRPEWSRTSWSFLLALTQAEGGGRA